MNETYIDAAFAPIGDGHDLFNRYMGGEVTTVVKGPVEWNVSSVVQFVCGRLLWLSDVVDEAVGGIQSVSADRGYAEVRKTRQIYYA